jgi:hypothetical protein
MMIRYSNMIEIVYSEAYNKNTEQMYKKYDIKTNPGIVAPLLAENVYGRKGGKKLNRRTRKNKISKKRRSHKKTNKKYYLLIN